MTEKFKQPFIYRDNNLFFGENEKQATPEMVVVFDGLEEEEAEKKAEAEAEVRRKEVMLLGADYNGYQVSFTAEDGNGMIQVKSGFELGLTSTTIHFENGVKMPITAEEFPAFALWFANERNKFFGGN